MDDNQCIDTSKDFEGHFGHFEFDDPLLQEARESRLLKVWRLMETNGSALRTISADRPLIMTPLTPPKKGQNQHKVDKFFGNRPYYYNDTFGTAYYSMKEDSIPLYQEMCFITATFNDETNRKLRELDAEPNSKETMIRKVQRWLRAYPYIKDAIFVIEECHKGEKVIVGDQSFKRLHVHLLTALTKDEQAQAKEKLFRKKIDRRVTLKTTWTSKRQYTELDELEEDQFGPIPEGDIDPKAEHWLNTYVAYENGKKLICIEQSGCLRAADYMSKSLGRQIGRGRNFGFIGLKGRDQLQKELSEKGMAILKELQDL